MHNPYQRPDFYDDGRVQPEPPGSWAPAIFKGLGILTILGIMVALLLPARRTVRDASLRTACGSQLRQLAMALHSYESTYQSLPPAYTTDADGKPLHSWRTLILRWLEQRQLYKSIDLEKPWDHPANEKARAVHLHAYSCPGGGNKFHTTYLAVVGPDSCIRSGSTLKLSDIRDSHDDTLMLVEVDAERSVHWMSPHDADEAMLLEFIKQGKMPHEGRSFQAAFADTLTQLLGPSVTPQRLRAMISIAGNDDALARNPDR